MRVLHQPFRGKPLLVEGFCDCHTRASSAHPNPEFVTSPYRSCKARFMTRHDYILRSCLCHLSFSSHQYFQTTTATMARWTPLSHAHSYLYKTSCAGYNPCRILRSYSRHAHALS